MNWLVSPGQPYTLAWDSPPVLHPLDPPFLPCCEQRERCSHGREVCTRVVYRGGATALRLQWMEALETPIYWVIYAGGENLFIKSCVRFPTVATALDTDDFGNDQVTSP
jgi:hypothetical protein